MLSDLIPLFRGFPRFSYLCGMVSSVLLLPVAMAGVL